MDIATATDTLLVERAQDGDTRAFEFLAKRYALLMRSYARRLLGSRHEAEDVVQEALIAAWNSLGSISNPEQAKSWLMRIVNNKSVDAIRKNQRLVSQTPLESAEEVIADADHRSPERQSLAKSQMEALAVALDALPEQQRQCWALREMGEMSYQEIAQELDLSTTAVRGQLARARAALIKEMEAWR